MTAGARRRYGSADEDPQESLDSLAGVLWHLSDAWSRRDDAGPREAGFTGVGPR